MPHIILCYFVPSRDFASPKSGGGFLVSQECLFLFLLTPPAVSETTGCPVAHRKDMHCSDKCTGVWAGVVRE